ncbi:MAG: hypothetical protein Q7T97_10685 [Burkholderiaceae bacterium]|nr:hypothetical protein [Burkholderiaceae bacterium]
MSQKWTREMVSMKSEEAVSAHGIVGMVGAGLLAATLLAACGPSDKQKAQWAEEKRIECLDKVCDGDVPPKVALDESVMKLNGQWFIAPRRYAMGFAGLSFYWPSKTPATGRADGQSYPERGQDFYDVGIEVFLSHHDGAMSGPSRYDHLRQAEAEGRLISKEVPRPELEVWHTRETDGRGPGLWYVATQYIATDPNGAVLSCRSHDPKFDRCVTAFEWKPGIAADMRFRAKHAADWPEIYQETIRVLQLIKKA